MNNEEVTNTINNFFGKVNEFNKIKYYKITNHSGKFYRYEDGVKEVDITTGSPVHTGRKIIFSSDYAFFSPVDTDDLYKGTRFTFQVNNGKTLKLICLDQDQEELFNLLINKKCRDFQDLLSDDNKFLSPETKENIKEQNILEINVVDLITKYYPYNSQGMFTGYRDSEPNMDRFINAIFYTILGDDFDGYASKRVPLSNGELFHSEFTINKHNAYGNDAKITQLEVKNSSLNRKRLNYYDDNDDNKNIQPPFKGTKLFFGSGFGGSKYKTRSKSKNKTAKKVKSPKRNKTKKNTKNICAICYEVMNKNTDNVTTLCNHMFHTDCLRNWCMRNNNNTTCPICRADIRDTCIRINPNTNSNNNNVLVTFYPSQQEDMNNYLNTGNIGDQIEQVTNAQLNYAIYEIALNDNGDRYLRQIGDIYGMFEGEVLLSPLLTSPPGTPSPTSPASPLTPIRNHNNISDNNITSNTPMMSYQNYINNITNANNSNTPPNSQEDISGNINPLDFLYDTPDNSRFSGGMDDPEITPREMNLAMLDADMTRLIGKESYSTKMRDILTTLIRRADGESPPEETYRRVTLIEFLEGFQEMIKPDGDVPLKEGNFAMPIEYNNRLMVLMGNILDILGEVGIHAGFSEQRINEIKNAEILFHADSDIQGRYFITLEDRNTGISSGEFDAYDPKLFLGGLLNYILDILEGEVGGKRKTKRKKSLKKKQRKTKKKGGKLSKNREDSPPPPRQPSSRRNMEPINTQVLEARLLRVNEILLQRFGNDDERIDGALEIQRLIRPGSFGSAFVYTNALGFEFNRDVVVDRIFVTMIIGLYDPNRPPRQGGKNIKKKTKKKKTKKNKTLKRKNKN